MKCGHKKAVSLAQNLTFESGVQSSVKLASYSFLVCVFIFLKLLRAAKQTFHLMASSLISLVFINGSGLAGCLAWLCARGARGKAQAPGSARRSARSVGQLRGCSPPSSASETQWLSLLFCHAVCLLWLTEKLSLEEPLGGLWPKTGLNGGHVHQVFEGLILWVCPRTNT